MSTRPIGISGFASYFPGYRVQLSRWCEWTGDQWDKVQSVVGTSFRMRGQNENAYTMAATAVLRLIRQYGIDPTRIGFLGLGTESSTDNSAGAVIVKGMVNQALNQLGMPRIHRACEVPEFKHACLGGVYAMKSAARYLALDGADQLAIVVCSDIAEYERATSGEPTQGAGAVAFVMEADPKLLALELDISGSASDYRGPDFRKPFSRFLEQAPAILSQPRDFPVFNGKYSTTCYVDEVLAAMRHLFSRLKERPSHFMRNLAATFLHRPYQRMAETGLVMSYLLALALGPAEDLDQLHSLAAAADVDGDALAAELTMERDLYQLVEQQDISREEFPLANATARAFRQTREFRSLMTDLGAGVMSEVGNLYTASLPAWMAAGLEQARAEGRNLAGTRILTIGYGSGDAAEAIPMRVVPGWEAAAAHIGFAATLETAIDLDQGGYERLHDNSHEMAPLAQAGVFYIDHIGHRQARFDDSGIEYYRFSA